MERQYMLPKIICGFAGIGKSTAAKNIPGVVDLESTPFEKDWNRYVKVAKHMLDSGFVVLLSCHLELRDELQKQGVPYAVAMPQYDDKEEYLRRFKERGNTHDFIALFEKNWEKYLQTLPNETVMFVKWHLSELLTPPTNN